LPTPKALRLAFNLPAAVLGPVLFFVGAVGAIVSLVVGLSSGEIIEAAMVGKDGVVGAFAALGGNIPINRAIVQPPRKPAEASINGCLIHNHPD
jgi:hypothetical protein